MHPRSRVTAEAALDHPWFRLNAPEHTRPEPLSIDILSKFRRFQGLSKLKKIALTVIAHHLDDVDVEGLRDVFMQLDSNRDGVLTSDEIRDGLKQSGVKRSSDIDVILNDLDASGKGSIDYTEFLAVCLHQTHYIQEEACRSAFRVFDIDGNGLISQNELKQVFRQTGDPDVDATAEFLEADVNGDGEIDFNEFCSLMKKVPSRTLLGTNAEETVSMMKKVSSRPSMG